MKLKWILISLTTLVLIVVLYLLSQLQWEKVEYDLGLSPEIKKDPFTMSQRFLALHDKQWQQIKARNLFDGFDQIRLDQQQVLLIDESILSESALFNQPLMDWVAQGGHLIYMLSRQRHQLSVEETDFFQSLDIDVEENPDFDFSVMKLDQIEDSNITLTLANEQQAQLFLEDRFDISYCPGDEYNSKGWDTLICDLVYDQGRVTVIPSLAPFTNIGLKHYDHASFLLWLLDDKESIAYLPYMVTDQWWQKLWQFSWQLVLAAALLIVLFIWQQSSRIGVAVGSLQTSTAPFQLHFAAIARFMWQHGHQDKLQQAIEQDFYQLVELRIPNFKQLSTEQQIQRISQLSQWPQEKVQRLLQQTMPDNLAERFDYIQQFQQLRKSL